MGQDKHLLFVLPHKYHWDKNVGKYSAFLSLYWVWFWFASCIQGNTAARPLMVNLCRIMVPDATVGSDHVKHKTAFADRQYHIKARKVSAKGDRRACGEQLKSEWLTAQFRQGSHTAHKYEFLWNLIMWAHIYIYHLFQDRFVVAYSFRGVQKDSTLWRTFEDMFSSKHDRASMQTGSCFNRNTQASSKSRKLNEESQGSLVLCRGHGSSRSRSGIVGPNLGLAW